MSRKIVDLIEQFYRSSNNCLIFEKEKFAEKICDETIEWIHQNVGLVDQEARDQLKQHFGFLK